MRLDDRKIIRIGWEPQEYMPQEYNTVSIGHNGVTKITSEEQNLGDHAICWLKVWEGPYWVTRFNARNVDSINYEPKE